MFVLKYYLKLTFLLADLAKWPTRDIQSGCSIVIIIVGVSIGVIVIISVQYSGYIIDGAASYVAYIFAYFTH